MENLIKQTRQALLEKRLTDVISKLSERGLYNLREVNSYEYKRIGLYLKKLFKKNHIDTSEWDADRINVLIQSLIKSKCTKKVSEKITHEEYLIFIIKDIKSINNKMRGKNALRKLSTEKYNLLFNEAIEILQHKNWRRVIDDLQGEVNMLNESTLDEEIKNALTEEKVPYWDFFIKPIDIKNLLSGILTNEEKQKEEAINEDIEQNFNSYPPNS